MILLTRIDPARNMARFYALSLAPTLFGEWLLVKEWGRIGQTGTVRAETHPMPRPLPRRSPARSASSAVAAIPRRQASRTMPPLVLNRRDGFRSVCRLFVPLSQQDERAPVAITKKPLGASS
jgi:predicted DNA-binding WGR domain protein